MTKRDHRSFGRGSRARRRISGEECCDSTPAEAGGGRLPVARSLGCALMRYFDPSQAFGAAAQQFEGHQQGDGHQDQ